jgi:hypothetical protein
MAESAQRLDVERGSGPRTLGENTYLLARALWDARRPVDRVREESARARAYFEKAKDTAGLERVQALLKQVETETPAAKVQGRTRPARAP